MGFRPLQQLACKGKHYRYQHISMSLHTGPLETMLTQIAYQDQDKR